MTSPDKAITKLESMGFAPRSYSGRGMYGATCVAVVLDRGEATKAISLKRLFGGPHTDSMGMGTVYYWRSLPWPPGREDSPEKEEPEEDWM